MSYYSGEEIKACADAGIEVTLRKPMTSGAKSDGRFGKQDFAHLADEDVYRCPAAEKLTYWMTRSASHPSSSSACQTDAPRSPGEPRSATASSLSTPRTSLA
jgi:hypothetical protein